jgi:excinuclease UvrABC ATPase subunit
MIKIKKTTIYMSAPNDTTRTMIKWQTKAKHLSIKDTNHNNLKNIDQLRMEVCFHKIGIQETKEALA